MSFPLSPSPPPPMPSPVLVPVSLPFPPSFMKKQTSHKCLTALPPSHSLNRAMSHDALHRATRSPRSAADPLKADSRPPSPFTRTIKRAFSSRCRSPPPSPAIRSPPPPVPPIPAFVLTTRHSFIKPSRQPESTSNHLPPLDLYLDRCLREDSANKRYDAQAGGPLTCVQFFAVHNQTGHCGT